MASVLKIKRSSVQGKAPTVGDIQTGELALNTRDGKLFSSDGTAVFEIGANVNSLSVGTGGLSLGNGAFSFPSQDGNPGQVLQTDGSGVLTWENFDSTADSASITTYTYTSSANQVSFGGVDDFGQTLSYMEDNIAVFLNGIKLVANTDFLASNGTSIFLSSGTSNTDVLEIQSFDKVKEFVDVNASLQTNTKISTANSEIVVDSFGTNEFRSIKYMVQVSNDDNNTQHQVSEVLLVHNGSATFTTEYGQVTTSTTFASIDSDVSGSTVRLKVTPTVTNSTIKVTRLGITV